MLDPHAVKSDAANGALPEEPQVIEPVPRVARSEFAFVPKCAHRHALKRSGGGHDQDPISCDNCSAEIAPSTPRWSCHPCDFDLCEMCLLRRLRRPEPNRSHPTRAPDRWRRAQPYRRTWTRRRPPHRGFRTPPCPRYPRRTLRSPSRRRRQTYPPRGAARPRRVAAPVPCQRTSAPSSQPSWPAWRTPKRWPPSPDRTSPRG